MSSRAITDPDLRQCSPAVMARELGWPRPSGVTADGPRRQEVRGEPRDAGEGCRMTPDQMPPSRQVANRRLAYADPPYLGCCKLYDHHHPDGPMPWDGRCWDDVETHHRLLTYLATEYDGWAYSATSVSLAQLLPLAPQARVAAWVKPFAAFKRNVRIAYTWEPVLFVPGRNSSKDGAPVGRDHIAESITLRKGFTGTKPERVCSWVLDLMGYVEGDTVDDLFVGTGVMGQVLAQGRIA